MNLRYFEKYWRAPRYKTMEGRSVFVTDKEDPRIFLAGYLRKVSQYEILIDHVCEDGRVSLVNLAKNLANLTTITQEEVQDRVKKIKRDNELQEDRENRMEKIMRKVKDRVI